MAVYGCVWRTVLRCVWCWQGGLHQPTVQLVAISHSGVRLLSRDKDLFEDNLDVISHVRYITTPYNLLMCRGGGGGGGGGGGIILI